MAKKKVTEHYHRVFKDAADYDRWRERNCVRCARQGWCRIRGDLFGADNGMIWIDGEGLRVPGFTQTQDGDGVFLRVHCRAFELPKPKRIRKPKPKRWLVWKPGFYLLKVKGVFGKGKR